MTLEAGNRFDTAEEGFRRLDHTVGLFTVDWARTELRIRQGVTSEDVTHLDILAAELLPATLPQLKVGLLVSRLCASAALGDRERLEKLTKEYEAVRRRHPSSSTDLRVYRCLGRFYADIASWEAAELAYRRALAAARNLYEEFEEPSVLEHFWRVQAKMLAEAKTCLQKQGKSKEAENLDAVFPPPSELRRQREESRWQRDRGYRRWALRVALLNAACVAGATVAWALLSRESLRQMPDMLAILSIFWIGMLVYALGLGSIIWFCRAIASWFVPRSHQRGSVVDIVIQIIPWGGLAVFLVGVLAGWIAS